MALWTLGEVCDALKVACEWKNAAIGGVNIDTRTLQEGDLFVALSGTPSGGFVSSFNSAGDGHDYVKMAEEKGAVAAVVNRRVEGVSMPQLMVPDTLMEGLWVLGAAARARFGGKVVGLTGSAGKSTTKEMLSAMLGCPASVASYNNFWGVPLTLARLPREADFAVVEMGMNQPGELARLAKLTRPHVALVVNVRPVHLEKLGSLKAIEREKMSIAGGLVEGGTLVIPHELRHSEFGMGDAARVVTFAVEGDADVQVVGMDATHEDWDVRVKVGEEVVEMGLPQGAPHRLWNAVAALATVHALGADVRAAAGKLAGAVQLAGRGVETLAGGVCVVDDSFNANPASVAASLLALKAKKVTGRKIAVLGDMLELGEEAPRYHAELAAECAGLDGVVCVGPLMQHLWAALPEPLKLMTVPDMDALDAKAVAALLRQGDRVAVKGSKKVFWVRGFVGKLVAALNA